LIKIRGDYGKNQELNLTKNNRNEESNYFVNTGFIRPDNYQSNYTKTTYRSKATD